MATVLIVDDSRVMRAALRQIMTDLGHEVLDEAGDGQEGLDKYKSLTPDIVTMDINMPVMDGITSAKHITEHNSKAKIFFVTSYDDSNVKSEAIVTGGAQDFILKPFEKEDIAKALKFAGIK